MNPDRIYRQHRDDALARQVEARAYETFVAMPFGERYSYRSRQVFEEVICAAADRANGIGTARRPFARPRRADDAAGTAHVITEEIVVGILSAHFFVADLTFQNPGVLLEAGAALGLKPNGQILLLFQGPSEDIHFDIRNNAVLNYDDPDEAAGVDRIAQALIEAAGSFEADRQRYVNSVVRDLSPDAVLCLRIYAHMWLDHGSLRPSLHRGIVTPTPQAPSSLEHFPYAFRPDEPTPAGVWPILFTDATRELIQKRLLFTEYQPNAHQGGDAFGMHATELGWAVIGKLWEDLSWEVIEQRWPKARRPSLDGSE